MKEENQKTRTTSKKTGTKTVRNPVEKNVKLTREQLTKEKLEFERKTNKEVSRKELIEKKTRVSKPLDKNTLEKKINERPVSEILKEQQIKKERIIEDLYKEEEPVVKENDSLESYFNTEDTSDNIFKEKVEEKKEEIKPVEVKKEETKEELVKAVVKKKKKIKVKSIVNIALFVISLGTLAMLTHYFNKVSIIPDKYFYLFLGVEALIILIGVGLGRLKKLIFYILSTFLFVLLIFVNCAGTYYVKNFDKFIDKGFVGDLIDRTEFYVVTRAANPVESIDSLTLDYIFNYYETGKYIDKAMDELGQYDYQPIDDVSVYLEENVENDFYLLVDRAYYETMFEFNPELKMEKYKVIHNFNVEVAQKRNNEVKDSYTILVMGKDFSGVRNDFNMLITVNTNTRKVLLTSMPRDSYMKVSGYNVRDSLMHMPVRHTDEEIIASLEDYFGIKIDFKVKLYTRNLVDIVDSLGGIEFCSNSSYTTSHAMILDSYDDWKGKKLKVKKGCYEYNGIEILTIARERANLPNGDYDRQENCRNILQTIIKKIMSTRTLTNYTEILDAFSDFYITDMNRNTVTILIRSFLKYGDYDINEQEITGGTEGNNVMGLDGFKSYVIYNDQDVVKQKGEYINSIIEGK